MYKKCTYYICMLILSFITTYSDGTCTLGEMSNTLVCLCIYRLSVNFDISSFNRECYFVNRNEIERDLSSFYTRLQDYKFLNN